MAFARRRVSGWHTYDQAYDKQPSALLAHGVSDGFVCEQAREGLSLMEHGYASTQ